jgi:hypothetical protein
MLLLAGPTHAQFVFGGSVGAYYRGPGMHPFVYAAGSLRAEYRGLGVEFLHSPTLSANGTARDLFSYRVTLRPELLSGPVRPFLLVGAGHATWRTWACRNGTCAAGVGGSPDGRFDYTHGLGVTVGGGVRLHASGPVWTRVDLRYEWSDTDAGVVALIGLGVTP